MIIATRRLFAHQIIWQLVARLIGLSIQCDGSRFVLKGNLILMIFFVARIENVSTPTRNWVKWDQLTQIVNKRRNTIQYTSLHGVVKEASSKTKLRFNASRRSYTGLVWRSVTEIKPVDTNYSHSVTVPIALRILQIGFCVNWYLIMKWIFLRRQWITLWIVTKIVCGWHLIYGTDDLQSH